MTLRNRYDLCRTLRTLAERQREALAERDYDALIGLLGEKRSAIERLAALTPVARDWAAARHAASDRERTEGEALLAETNRLLAEVSRVDADATEELTRQRDATRNDLSEINAAGRVHSAYRDALAPATHRSLDVDR